MVDAALDSRENYFEKNSDKQTRWWLFTFPYESFEPFYLHDSVAYARGQCEISPTGYWHWHVMVGFKRSQRFSYCKSLFGDGVRIECCRSRDNCLQYVWKDRTSIPFSRFEHGVKPVRRSSKRDWDETLDHAKEGNFDNIDASVLIQHYGNLKKIRSDNLKPKWRNNIKVYLFWGLTNCGKSYRAFQEAGPDAYIKQGNTKWWCGYRGETSVVIDEFDGSVGITHLLKWFQQYPCMVETKGGNVPLQANTFYLTSNLRFDQWYPNAHQRHLEALERRFTVIEYFNTPYSE